MCAGLIRPSTMHEHNAYIVLQLVARQGPLARADIARILGFSRSTVSGIVEFLVGERLLTVAGRGNPRTGRKSELLIFDPGAVCHIGVDLRRDAVELSSIDLAGRINERTSCPLDSRDRVGPDPAQVVEAIVSGWESLTSGIPASDMLPSSPLAIGVMVPGIVDADTGTVVYSSNLGWSSPVKLGEMLCARLASNPNAKPGTWSGAELVNSRAERMSLPVYLENDANALALAESWVGAGRDFAGLVYLLVEHGVGGAYVARSQLFRGSNYAGVEAGKTLVHVPGETIPRTVEWALAVERLVERFGPCGRGSDNLYEFIAHSKDVSRAGVAYIGGILGQLSANIIALLNPDAILIDAPLAQAHDALLSRIIKDTRSLLPSAPEKAVRILPSSLRREDRVVGGAALAVYRGRFRFLITGSR